VYVVGGLYVAVGLIFAARHAYAGDVVNTLVGLLIVTGALGGAFALLRALSLAARLWRVTETLDEVRAHLRALAAANHTADAEAQAAEAVKLMNLAAVGNGDPSLLSAATLDRSRYPRLVRTLDEVREHPEGPADVGGAPPGMELATGAVHTPAPVVSPPAEPNEAATSPTQVEDSLAGADGPSTQNLLRLWTVALRNHDLEECRRTFSALTDLAEAQVSDRLHRELVGLEQQTQRGLCGAFREAIRGDNYAAALTAGARLHTLFPDSQAARDFARLEPHLRRRLEARFADTGS